MIMHHSSDQIESTLPKPVVPCLKVHSSEIFNHAVLVWPLFNHLTLSDYIKDNTITLLLNMFSFTQVALNEH